MPETSVVAESQIGILSAFPGPFVGIGLPFVPHWAEPCWHLFVVRSEDRDSLQAALTARRIGMLIHYPVPLHLQDACRSSGYSAGRFLIAETIAREVLSLSTGSHLGRSALAKIILTEMA